ncbi:ATP-binding protein [Kribbella italica]|uniref:Putative ATPase/DNA-binding CsgD family transcriptional regulator n=1 Tax=Kribbella italica TaxID=1540520 RepID=A0A7W9J4L8_9ACTN|nr:LuxR C-terminal-related transcriptional regulator [Kribbella italica]MBB5835537.1 putative ATPase/DNA-binding CsgD family transcriptional regulator [Kribbella italica]
MDWRESISAREGEVLSAIRGHQSNAQIAARLHLSVRTVESHVASLLRKAGVPDRRTLAALAEERAGAGLPVFPTSFIGRESERAAVVGALDGSRLVNLVGAGGMGKTRLAVEVAAGLDRDAVFVDLVPVRAGGVGQAVAQALGVVERPPGTPADAVIDQLRTQHSLLVLDNCEQVSAEVGELVARILRSCPRATILATSRERLAVPGERLVQLPPLGAEAERLFVDRARATDPDLVTEPAAVTRLCAGLDGMPLAIELVAARAASLGVDGAQAALDDLLRLISGGRGPDQRHHSLQDVIGWSLELLDDEERLLFRRLGMFVGGFDLEAVAALSPELGVGAVADLVGRLADRSLVVHRRVGTTTRWSLLETVRAVAVHELTASGEDIGPRYVRWAADTAVQMEARIEQLVPAEFDAVADDLRNALAQVGPRLREAPTAYQLAKSLARLSFWRGHVVAARDLYCAAADLDPASAAEDLATAASVALATADGETGFRLLLQAADAAGSETARAVPLAAAVVAVTRFSMSFTDVVSHERLVELLAEASALADPADPRSAAVLAMARAWVSGQTPLDPDLDLSRAAVAAARRTGDDALVLGALDALGTALANAGQLRQAHRLSDERLRLAVTASRSDPAVVAELIDLFHVASTSALAAGDLPAAAAIAEQASRQDSVGIHPAIIAPRLIRLHGLSGDFDRALAQADVLWEGWLSSGAVSELTSLRGDWPSSAVSVVAMVYGVRGDGPQFEEWRSRALRVARVEDAADSLALAAPAAFADARVAVHTGRYDDAPRLVAAALAAFPQKWWLPYAHAAGAELAVVAGLPDAAERLAEAGPAAAENDWAAACLARAAARRTGDLELLAESVAQWERLGARFERAVTLQLIPFRADEGAAELAALKASQ